MYDTVRAVGEQFCPALGIAIPVGKDSMSMKSVWNGSRGRDRSVTAPLSLIISAFAPVCDVRQTLTPQLRTDSGDTDLILLDLGLGNNRLGGSALAQVYKQLGSVPPDLDEPSQLKAFFAVIQSLNASGKLLAYHDRSDGGLFACICEMCFAAHCGVSIQLQAADAVAALFAEELGAVMQVRRTDTADVMAALKAAGLEQAAQLIGTLATDDRVNVCGERAGHVVRKSRRLATCLVRDQLPAAGTA